MARQQGQDESGRLGRIETEHHRDDVIVTKVSGEDIDRAIDRLSVATAPYFRAGGPLMPHKPL